MNYYHVTDGSVDLGPRTLPRSWGSVSGIDMLDDASLALHGWLPEEIVGFEPFDPDTQVRSNPVLTVQADRVTATYTVSDKPIETLRSQRIGEVRAEAVRRLDNEHDALDRVWGLAKGIKQLVLSQPLGAGITQALDFIDNLRTNREALITFINGATITQLQQLTVADESWWV